MTTPHSRPPGPPYVMAVALAKSALAAKDILDYVGPLHTDWVERNEELDTLYNAAQDFLIMLEARHE